MPISRWCLLAAVTVAVLGLMLSPGAVVAAQFRTACQLAGAASFAQAATSPDVFTYSFRGALNGCRIRDTASPPTGTVEAGQTITVPYYWSYVDAMTGATFSGNAYATYQEPIPSGTGGCSGSSGTGSALVTWADRSTTVLAFRSGGSAAAIGLNGTVLPSLGLALTGYTGPAQAPPGATYVVTSTRFASESLRGVLFFEPPNPMLCNHLRRAQGPIGGEVGLGTTG